MRSALRYDAVARAIDTGFEAPAVHAWSRKAGCAQVVPDKGVECSTARAQCRDRPMSTRQSAPARKFFRYDCRLHGDRGGGCVQTGHH